MDIGDWVDGSRLGLGRPELVGYCEVHAHWTSWAAPVGRRVAGSRLNGESCFVKTNVCSDLIIPQILLRRAKLCRVGEDWWNFNVGNVDGADRSRLDSRMGHHHRKDRFRKKIQCFQGSRRFSQVRRSFHMQHCLYFLPLPQGQGAFRGTRSLGGENVNPAKSSPRDNSCCIFI